MIARRVAIALAVAGAYLTGSAHAQGLGNVAAREKAKRAESKAKKTEAKVFTNTELEEGRPPGWKDEGAGESVPSEASPESSPTPGEGTQPRTVTTSERAEQERSYLEAITEAQQGVNAAEGRVRQLQEKLNPMSVAYIYGAGGSNDANEELRVRQELTQAEAQLQGARQQLGTANKGLQDFRQGRPSSPPEER
jgi:hypothetical protein